VAQELADFESKCRDGKKGSVSIVQFHPTYSYEDFVEGYRPVSSPSGILDTNGGSGMVFKLVEGPLKELATKATKNPRSLFVLIIDELNRGNVARIFGELFFLLEYRGKSIKLQYSNSAFSLPPNLMLIATMNTIDRSLARLDRALRRRFFFIPFLLEAEPVKGLLPQWLAKNKPEMRYVNDVVVAANQILHKFDESASIGPSHFMTHELNKEWFELIWKYSIVPEVEEFIDDEQSLKEFKLLPFELNPKKDD
jgi:5-methylcytosine-specific restriction endonuclease McrBC GTP-binding regulatory subunit McrB